MSTSASPVEPPAPAEPSAPLTQEDGPARAAPDASVEGHEGCDHAHHEEPIAAKERRALQVPSTLGGWIAWPLLLLITFYRRFISPLTPPSCRFYPTCSAYGLEALQVHGPLKGTALTVWRILRCQPFGKGGYDPVPPRQR